MLMSQDGRGATVPDVTYNQNRTFRRVNAGVSLVPLIQNDEIHPDIRFQHYKHKKTPELTNTTSAKFSTFAASTH